jgi:hypothetical protein
VTAFAYSFDSCPHLIKINPIAASPCDENALSSVDVCPQFDSLESIRPQFDNRGEEP